MLAHGEAEQFQKYWKKKKDKKKNEKILGPWVHTDLEIAIWRILNIKIYSLKGFPKQDTWFL